MSAIKGIRMLAACSLLAIVILLLAACGVSQSEYDQTKSQLLQQDQRVNALQQQLSAKEKEIAELKQASAAVTPVAAATGGNKGTILIGVVQVSPPPPKPTNTPLPPGFTPPAPPAAPVPPNSFSESLALYIRADTVTSGAGESSYNLDATSDKARAACAVSSVFKRGMHLVWRFEVVETSTGKRLTDKDVDKALVVLPGGQELKGRFGRHGATDDSPWFWSAAWDIPLDYPVGVLDWSVNVTAKNGKTGSFKPWAIAAPERGVDSRTQIVD